MLCDVLRAQRTMGFKCPQINEVRTDPILPELVRKIIRRIFSRFLVSFHPWNTVLVVLSFLEILYDRITNISESDHPRSYEATKAVVKKAQENSETSTGLANPWPPQNCGPFTLVILRRFQVARVNCWRFSGDLNRQTGNLKPPRNRAWNRS